MKKKEKNSENVHINGVEICTLFSTVATLILVVFTAFQVFRYGRSMRADFAHKIKIDFFNENERALIFLLNYDLLEFVVMNNDEEDFSFSYFVLNKDKYSCLRMTQWAF